MKKINGLVKKLKICGIMLGCSILLSGCDKDLSEFYDNPGVVVQNRIDQNRELINKLHISGFLDDDTYKTLDTSLKSNTKKIRNQLEGNSSDIPEALRSSTRWVLTEGNRVSIGNTEVDGKFKYPILHEYVSVRGTVQSELKPDWEASAFSIMTEKDEKHFIDMIGMKIYVLDTDVIGEDLSNISAACKKIKEESFIDDNDKKNCYSVLLKYFKDSGETILDADEKLIIETTRHVEAEQANDTVGPENKMGLDLVIYSNGYATSTFRLRELNADLINKIVGTGSFSESKYIQVKANDINGTTNALYLMEYPISYIESMEYDKSSSKAKVNIATSESIKVNIMTGEVVNIHGNDVLDATTKAAMEKLLNVTPSNSSGQSSFVLWNKAENLILSDGTYKDSSGTEVNKDNIEIGPTGHMTNGTNDVTEQGKKAETNTILLRDYLELNYMPGVVSEQERFVTLGRRLRINDLNTDGTVKDIEKPFANFVDKNGVVVEGGSVMITDLIDTSSGNKDNEKKSIKLAVYDDVGEKDLAGATSDTGFTLDAIENTFEKVEYKDKISVTMQFPVEDSLNDNHIAIDDASYNFGSESRGIYYGMATDVNVFSSNLYSGWINISNAESGGIKWWNSWLENNKYSYRINEENLLAYLGLNFTAQMAKEGENYIVFNEETVKKLNEDIRQKERVDKATGVRTAFVLMGFLIIMYALVFISAWVVDTATANSIGMLKAITGGHCVAVQDDMDIPSVDASSTKYITFGSALIRGILIIAIGILLIKTDILGLAGSIFNAFKGIGAELFNRLFNI